MIRALLFCVLLSFLNLANAQSEFESYWKEFQTAVRADDEEKILSLCQFPMSGNVDNLHSEKGYTEGEFLKDFDHFFDEHGRAVIKKATIEDFTYTDISERAIPGLEFPKGYTLFVSYSYPEYETDSSVIFTFAYIQGKWKLARIDIAG